ncbi:MAG TPA: hypothetical protein VFE55_04750 [Acidimicrobiia bacterium]|jgi:hypothetical protein|nr:hypothetical protein [Acidimicrobiia bacterium]
MKTWWFGNLLLFVIVVPAVNVLVNRTLTAILDIQTHARSILDNVVSITGKLDEVPELLTETDEVVKQVAAGALRYAASLDTVAELH